MKEEIVLANPYVYVEGQEEEEEDQEEEILDNMEAGPSIVEDAEVTEDFEQFKFKHEEEKLADY